MNNYISTCFSFLLLLSITNVAFAQTSPAFLDKNLVAEKIAEGFDKSSGFEFVSDRDILILQKDDGTVKHIRDFQTKKYSVLDVNVFNYESDSGLLGITSTNMEGKTYVFLFYTENNQTDGGEQFSFGLGNRVYRYEWNGVELVNPVLVLDLPSAPSPFDSGGKIAIGPDDQLYTIIGDLTREGKEQNMPDKDPSLYWLYDNKTESSGILRTTIDGAPSEGNPFTEKGFERYYAYGIRNSFGIAFDPVTGNLWDSEKGPESMDELNLVKSGFNSGWKQIQGWSSDVCCPEKGLYLSQSEKNLYLVPGSYYSDPEYVWPNAASVTAIAFLESPSIGPNYENDMFVGDMQGNIYHFELDESREDIISSKVIANNFGSISDIKTGPDGNLYVLTFANTTGFPIGSGSGELYRVKSLNSGIASEPISPVEADVMGAVGILAISSVIAAALLFRMRKRG